jgi:hypothetical protein
MLGDLRFAAGKGLPRRAAIQERSPSRAAPRAESGAVSSGWLVDAGIGRDGMFVAPHGGFWNLLLRLLFFAPVRVLVSHAAILPQPRTDAIAEHLERPAGTSRFVDKGWGGGQNEKASIRVQFQVCTRRAVPEWRNWQTRQVQDLVLAREWRFESSFGHQNQRK